MLVLTGGGLAMVQPGFSDVDGRLATLSSAGDPLERLSAAVDFELFRAMLDAALVRSDRSRGGRPPNDAVLMFKVLVLQALYSLSDDAAEFQARDRLSFMRFPGLGLGDRVPNAKTIWLSREQFVRPDPRRPPVQYVGDGVGGDTDLAITRGWALSLMAILLDVPLIAFIWPLAR